MSSKRFTLADVAAPIRNAIVGGPFGSNLVSKDYVATGVPVIRGQNMGGKWVSGEFAFVSAEKAGRLSQNLARPGDLVFTQRGTLGQVSIVPRGPYDEYVVSQSQMKITVDPTKADVSFLYYLFRTPAQLRYIFNSAIQTGVPHTNLGILKATPIDLPPLSIQKDIAAIVGALDDRIALLRETNATLEAIAQALFKSWFIDFDPVRAKIQGLAPASMDEATAAFFPDEFEESALGPTPRGWPILRIEELAHRVGMGPFGSNIKVETFVDAGIPVLNGANVQGALLEDVDFRFVTEEHAARLRNSCVGAGDIVLTHRGTLGQVSLVPSGSKYPEYVLSQSQFYLRCSPSIMEPEWMLYFLRSPLGRHLLLANASQVGVPSIARPSSYLRSIRLVVPPISIVNRFAEAARSLHAAVVGNREQVQTLGALRDTLLPRLISGQLRLSEALVEMEEAA